MSPPACCATWDENPTIAETPLMRAVLDRYPVTEGHALVFPKRHVDRFTMLRPQELIDLSHLITCIKLMGDAGDLTIAVNDGPLAGRTVSHLHVHVIPRRPGDVTDPRGGVRRLLIPNPNDDPWITQRNPDREPGEPDSTTPDRWTHGTRLGREHRSVRRHLVEDHGVDQAQVDAWSDGAVHGHHDGVHGKTWAYADNLPHWPQFGDYKDPAAGEDQR
jgi:diadenosine tetraphosphate (Ap4A) HIT family hydrolase